MMETFLKQFYIFIVIFVKSQKNVLLTSPDGYSLVVEVHCMENMCQNILRIA